MEVQLQIVDGIRHLYLPKLNTVSRCASQGLRKWLSASDTFIPITTPDTNCVEFSLYDPTDVVACWASDIVRLGCASVETLFSISENPNDKKFLAWQAVEYYYAAFYAAHCTLKICGFGLIQIDNSIISNIRTRASTLGVPVPNIVRGTYCVNIDPITSKMTLYRVSRYDDSHKGLWQRYTDFLSVLIGTSVSTAARDSNCIRLRKPGEATPLSVYSHMPTSDAQAIVSRLEDIRSMLNQRGDNNWLSHVRNELNYSHAFGVWHPFKAYNDCYSTLPGMYSLFLQNPLCSDFSVRDEPELLAFAKCCQLVNSINREIILDLSVRHPDNKSFLRTGPISFLNLHFNP